MTSDNDAADGRSVGRSGSKRRRNDDIVSEIENVTSGSLEVEECDPHGKFVRIKNNSNDVIHPILFFLLSHLILIHFLLTIH